MASSSDRQVAVHGLQAAQVEKEIAVFAWLDRRTDELQLGQDGFEHRRRPHRVWLQDDGVRAQRHDLAQQQPRPHAGGLGLGRAQLDDLAFARRAAEHQRATIPGGVAQHLNPQRQLRDPDAGDPYVGPGVAAHGYIIELTFYSRLGVPAPKQFACPHRCARSHAAR